MLQRYYGPLVGYVMTPGDRGEWVRFTDVCSLLAEARQIVDIAAGDNRPAPEWAREVRDKIDAAVTRLVIDPR